MEAEAAVIDPPSSEDAEPAGGFASLGSAIRLLVVAWAAVIASFPLNDNSFFTHLATGRLILDERSVPSSDPYTFTARGTDWTVQSWLASVLYASAERIAGAPGLRLLVLAIFVVAALLLWRLSRPAESLLLRLLIVAAALFVATGLWAERPYMVGVIGLSVVWLALEGTVRAWLLVPLVWVWANSHGSYPLGIALVLAVLAGEALDRRRHRPDDREVDLRTELRTELGVLKTMVAGTLLAMIGPLGVDVLLFPVKALTQSDLLSEIVEWQPPGFRSIPERVFLLLVLATLAGLVRDGRWRFALPTIAFVGAAVVAQRNVVMATMVLVPVLAATVPKLGTLTADTRPGLGAAFTAVCGAAVVLAGSLVLSGPTWGLGAYPLRPLSWLDASGPPAEEVRIATQDRTGNLVGLLDGPSGTVFIDDRADMFPQEVFDDYVSLVRGRPDWAVILDRYEIDAVIWERTMPLASVLAADDRWRTVYADTEWLVSCRREGDACRQLTG